MSDLFLKAAQEKYRFASNKGLLTSEDLFDLNLTELNKVAKSINAQLKNEGEEDFIDVISKASTALSNKLEVVKSVIAIKKEARDLQEQHIANAAEKQKLLSLIESKETAQLAELPIEELRKRVESLL